MSCCEIKEIKNGREFEVWEGKRRIMKTKHKRIAQQWCDEHHAKVPKPEPVQSPAAPLKASIKPVNVKPTNMP